MHLESVELIDVRSHERTQVALGPTTSVFIGPNAQGKTNFLEAIYRAASGVSHRTANDAVLIRIGADSGAIRLQVRTDEGRRRTIDVEIGGRRARTHVDGNPVRRASEAVGVVRAIMFAPEDLDIVRGDPAARRSFLDQLLAQRRPAFATVRAEYERTLRQRNQLLKQLRGLDGSARAAARSTLETWTDQLIRHGSQILAARHAALETLQSPVDTAYRRLADRPEPVSIQYRSTVSFGAEEGREQRELEDAPVSATQTSRIDLAALQTHFAADVDAVIGDEIRRGVTLVGPHRDDLELFIGGLPARTHASHGEAWSLALALKLGGADLLASVGDRPIILLDDVFAELDQTRRVQLAQMCGEFDQVIVSAAVEADVPLTGNMFDVHIEDGRSTVTPRNVHPQAAQADLGDEYAKREQ